MLGLLIYSAVCVVQVDLTKQFQTFYTDATETYEVNPNASELVFFFVQKTASWVTLSGPEITPISIIRPYTFAVKANASVLVETSSSTSVMVIVDRDNDCANGAFYLAGGKAVEVNVTRDVGWWGHTIRYCMFSPSSEGVEVEFGMEGYSLGSDKVKMVYQRPDGVLLVSVCSGKICSKIVENAYYYVSYQSGRLSLSRLVYGRTNTRNADGYTKCDSRPISYYPGQIADRPYDVLSSLGCSTKKSKVEKILLVVCGVLMAVGALLGVFVKLFCSNGKEDKSGSTTKFSLLSDSLP